MLTDEQASVLTIAVRDGKNIPIAGATSTGRTTVENVLADAIPEHEHSCHRRYGGAAYP
jgi:Flp pilus assembly CpaF family ATPase